MTNCIDCGYHSVIPDPDPTDSFNYDDVAVVCTLKQNDDIKPNSKYLADRNAYKCITVSCRPHYIRKESDTPDWCPKIKEIEK
jgi:hypothetical protein